MNKLAALSAVDVTAFTIYIEVPAELANQSKFDVSLSSGIYNPPKGPYSLKSFAFEFQTKDGAPIDALLSDDTYAVVNCDGYCSTC